MHKFDLKNRTAVITGGAKGFGFDIAKKFLESGARVFNWDVDEKLIKSVIDQTKNPNLEFNVVYVAVNAVTPASAKTRILDQMSKEHVQRML